jgi:cadmium resistance protein CadD (predicted permease)
MAFEKKEKGKGHGLTLTGAVADTEVPDALAVRVPVVTVLTLAPLIAALWVFAVGVTVATPEVGLMLHSKPEFAGFP